MLYVKNPVVVKVLSIVGSILVLVPILFMLVTSVFGSIAEGTFLMDFLLPAELGYLVVAGAALLLLGAWRSKPYRLWILVGCLAAVAMFVLMSVYAVLSGLADGSVGEDSVQFYVVIGMCLAYDLMTVWIGFAGILHVVNLFRKS
jgi:hypothetical protein